MPEMHRIEEQLIITNKLVRNCTYPNSFVYGGKHCFNVSPDLYA